MLSVVVQSVTCGITSVSLRFLMVDSFNTNKIVIHERKLKSQCCNHFLPLNSMWEELINTGF